MILFLKGKAEKGAREGKTRARSRAPVNPITNRPESNERAGYQKVIDKVDKDRLQFFVRMTELRKEETVTPDYQVLG